MATIAVISQKGGAGKTTLALHLAVMAQISGVPTVVMDTDPQATAARWGTWREGRDPDVIDCASPPLLSGKIEKLRAAGCKFVVIDTPPVADQMPREACNISDLVLIPCRPRAFDLDAIRMTADLAKSVGKPAFVVFMAGPVVAPKLYEEATELVEGQFGLKVVPVRLAERADYHHSVAEGKAAVELDPNGKAADECRALWSWLTAQLKKDL